jgi:hypothetical protein
LHVAVLAWLCPILLAALHHGHRHAHVVVITLGPTPTSMPCMPRPPPLGNPHQTKAQRPAGCYHGSGRHDAGKRQPRGAACRGARLPGAARCRARLLCGAPLPGPGGSCLSVLVGCSLIQYMICSHSGGFPMGRALPDMLAGAAAAALWQQRPALCASETPGRAARRAHLSARRCSRAPPGRTVSAAVSRALVAFRARY